MNVAIIAKISLILFNLNLPKFGLRTLHPDVKFKLQLKSMYWGGSLTGTHADNFLSFLSSAPNRWFISLRKNPLAHSK